MSPNEQRIAIAEACGWTNIREREFGRGLVGEHPTIKTHAGIDDYLNDLNACHEMEKHLGQLRSGIYSCELRKIISKFNSEPPYVNSFEWHATAAQRCEAFLKTLGLWRDDASHLSKVASDATKH